MRLQLTQGFGYGTLGMTNMGDILPSFADSWDAVLSDAERNGLGVIVVFTLWGDWNDGTPALPRCTIPGDEQSPLAAGSVVEVHGRVSRSEDVPVIFNPRYELLLT